jgi:hypothetical protein
VWMILAGRACLAVDSGGPRAFEAAVGGEGGQGVRRHLLQAQRKLTPSWRPDALVTGAVSARSARWLRWLKASRALAHCLDRVKQATRAPVWPA